MIKWRTKLVCKRIQNQWNESIIPSRTTKIFSLAWPWNYFAKQFKEATQTFVGNYRFWKRGFCIVNDRSQPVLVVLFMCSVRAVQSWTLSTTRELSPVVTLTDGCFWPGESLLHPSLPLFTILVSLVYWFLTN